MTGLDKRKKTAHQIRVDAADHQRDLPATQIPPGSGPPGGPVTVGGPTDPPATNGDEDLYPNDFRATYHKCLDQAYGFANPVSFASFRAVMGPSDGSTLGSGDCSLIVPFGLGRRLNGPRGAFAYTLVGADSHRFRVVVPPSYTSPEYATELVELYWASLLRDVAFTEYASNPIALQAATELTTLNQWYAGPTQGGTVTPDLLFRGALAGEDAGPYLSQFLLQPTALGSLPVPQRYNTYAPGVDYLTDVGSWNAVQGGAVAPTSVQVPSGTPGFLHDGRGLGAYTRVDELYQAYFVAYLVLNSFGVEANPTNPYGKNRTALANEQPFGTFGGPDIAATLAAVAREALNAVWYQKWVVHLRHRPESGGGMVERYLTSDPSLKITPGNQPDLDQVILQSNAVQQSYQTFQSHLLAQAFPEGSPAHPAYPTGHGTVAGACITVLKYFFNGDQHLASAAKARPIVQPSSDGQGLDTYTGADADVLTVNGELHKLAHNISFGHGIHSGIHWRSDTDASIALGEAVAIEYLKDQKHTYQEKPEVRFTRLDGGMQHI